MTLLSSLGLAKWTVVFNGCSNMCAGLLVDRFSVPTEVYTITPLLIIRVWLISSHNHIPVKV